MFQLERIPGCGPRHLSWHCGSQPAAGHPVQAWGRCLPSLSSLPGPLLAFSGLGGLTLKLVGEGEGNQVSCLVFSSPIFLGLLCPSVYVSLDLCCLSPRFPTLPTKRLPREVLGSPAGKPSWEIPLESVNPSTHQSHFSSLPSPGCLVSVLLCLSQTSSGVTLVCSNPGPTE